MYSILASLVILQYSRGFLMSAELKRELKYWRSVYWRVWGEVNSLECTRCGTRFPLTQLGQCRYHPDTDSASTAAAAGGPLDATAYRFDLLYLIREQSSKFINNLTIKYL